MGLLGNVVPDFLPEPSEENTWTAGHIALRLPFFSSAETCDGAHARFTQNPNLTAAAVVDPDGHVVGIVNRLKFFAHYAQRYVPELYGRRSVLALSNRAPLRVDAKMPVGDLAAMITFDHPEALRECFVVTENGTYYGIGTGEALMRSKVSLLTMREKQLHQALAAAQEACLAKSTFLALMSHELRTPLNAIIGFSEILSHELFGPVGVPRYKEYATDIHSAGRHLLSLINDILDLSKAEAQRLDLSPEPVSLPDFCSHCLLFVSERAREHTIALKCVVPPDLPQLNADPLRLKQIVLNLLSNAVKFTPSGGSVTLEATVRPDGGICLCVRDTGIGMAAKDIPLALEPFRQVDSPMSRREEGTGLGLSLVKTLTELHGGNLEIDSAINAGTTVRVIFPAERSLRKVSAA